MKTSSTYKKFSEILAKGVDPHFIDPHTGEDTILDSIAKEIKFNGLPKIKSAKEISSLAKQGHIELFRGVNNPKFNDQLKHGNYFAGNGEYGNGIYCAVGKTGAGIALKYSDRTKNDSVSRMILDKNSNIINSKELAKQMDEELSKIDKQSESLEYKILCDPGRWAALHGYDAIFVEIDQYMVVLNRRKLSIQEETINNEHNKLLDELSAKILAKEYYNKQNNENAVNNINKEITQLEQELKW